MKPGSVRRGTSPVLSVAVCTHRRYDALERAIASLAAQTLAADELQIIVVDNGPDPKRSLQEAKRYSTLGNLTWYHSERAGLSQARNRAFAEALAPVIAYIDDDARADPDWAASALAALAEAGPAVQVIGGRVRPGWPAERPAWLADSLLAYLSVLDWGDVPRLLGANEWIVGTNMAFRTEALRQIGGFDPLLGRTGQVLLLSNDETDVIARLTGGGAQALYVPQMSVTHDILPDRLTQEWFRRRIVWQAFSDYVRKSEQLFANAATSWSRVASHFATLPAKERTPAGLFADRRKPGDFAAQIAMLYDFTICCLTGFHGIDGFAPGA